LSAALPLGCAASSIVGPAAAGSLNVIASFTAKTSRLDIATFADPNQKPSTVGLLSISQTNAVALGAADWKSLIDLVHKAAAAAAATAPASAAWTEAGSIKDVSKDVATLTVSSGPGVRFVISSARGGTVTHILPKSDIARLEKALAQVGDALSK
jgi:plastocyanin